MIPVILESGFGKVSWDDDVFTLGGMTPMPVVNCQMFGGVPDPADCYDLMLDAWSSRKALQPKCVKLEWFGARSFGVVGIDTYLRPSAEQVIKGLQSGMLDFEQDLEILRPWGTRVAKRKTFPDIIHINEESGFGPFSFIDVAATPEQYKAQAEASNQRNSQLMLAIMRHSGCRASMGPALNSISQNATDAQILAQLDFWNQHPDSLAQFELRLAELGAFWGRRKALAIRRCLFLAGCIGPSTRIVVSFLGNFRHFVVDTGGHYVGSIKLPPNFGSNFQLYDNSGIETMRAVAMSESTGWIPTYDHSAYPWVLKHRLELASPNGCFLFAPDSPRRVDHLLEVISQFTR